MHVTVQYAHFVSMSKGDKAQQISSCFLVLEFLKEGTRDLPFRIASDYPTRTYVFMWSIVMHERNKRAVISCPSNCNNVCAVGTKRALSNNTLIHLLPLVPLSREV